MNDYNCGCGQPVISSPPKKKCDGCIVLPKSIRWLCSDGPLPGGTMTFNIASVSGDSLVLPQGSTYVFSLYDFDKTGIDSVTISSVGDVVVNMKHVYVDRKEYRVRYKVKENAPGVRSNTGSIYICMRNRCVTCVGGGTCDPITGDCMYINDVEKVISCGNSFSINVPNWNINGVIEENVPTSVYNLNYNNSTKLLTGNFLIDTVPPIEYVLVLSGVKGTVKKMATVKLKVLDLSIGVICDSGEFPNKCTGECETISTDLSAQFPESPPPPSNWI